MSRLTEQRDEYVEPECTCGLASGKIDTGSVFGHPKSCPRYAGGKFIIRTVPRPPLTEHNFVRRHREGVGGHIYEVVSVRYACPKCHNPTELQYESSSISPQMWKRLMEICGEISGLEFGVIAIARGRNDPLVRKLIDVCEELVAKWKSVF